MKLYMFRTVPLPIIRGYSLYIQQWYMSYRFVDSFRAAAGSGWNCSFIQWRTEGGIQPPPPRNSEVLTKLSRIPSSVEYTSVTV
jgi:hypothetical protein